MIEEFAHLVPIISSVVCVVSHIERWSKILGEKNEGHIIRIVLIVSKM